MRVCADIQIKKSPSEFFPAGIFFVYLPKSFDMNFNQLDFATYCIGLLSNRMKWTLRKTYNILKDSGILYGYIVPGFEVLHTFSKEYILEDLIDCMKEKKIAL